MKNENSIVSKIRIRMTRSLALRLCYVQVRLYFSRGVISALLTNESLIRAFE